MLLDHYGAEEYYKMTSEYNPEALEPGQFCD